MTERSCREWDYTWRNFQLLFSLNGQIQDDVNADKMTEEEKKEEAVNLRVKLEELIASTSNVSEAVLTFRDFVLKFCGGKGDAEEKPDGGKEGNESDDSEWTKRNYSFTFR